MKKNSFFIIIIFLLTFQAHSQNWEALGNGLDNAIRGMYADTVDNYLYAAGMFQQTTTDGRRLQGIARWDGVKWDSLGNGITLGGNTFAFARYNNDLYVGGTFDSVGKMKCKGLGIWKGTYWDTLSVQPFKRTTYNHAVLAMCVVNSNLYFGGFFDSVENTPSRSFAKWNGSSIIPIGVPPNLNGAVNISTICEYHGYIYVGGLFATNLYPYDTIQNIMRYDGNNWSTVGGGMKGASSWINSMLVYNDELYVGGYFSKANGNKGNFIQKWDGFNWSEVGGGLDGYNGVLDMKIFHNKLFAVGAMQVAGGVPAQCFASWDGTNWCGYGSAFDNTLNKCVIYKDSLYIGGGFWTIDGDSINRVSKWIGENNIDTCGHLNVGVNEIASDNDFRIYPNPTKDKITIEFELTETKNTSIEIRNVLGQLVYLKNEGFTGGRNSINIYIDDFVKGLYFVQLTSKGKSSSEKIIKQ